jgi:hypothetical protein
VDSLFAVDIRRSADVLFLMVLLNGKIAMFLGVGRFWRSAHVLFYFRRVS